MSSKEEKAKTLAERFGFKDKDLTTPEHDRMLLWVLNKINCLTMLEKIGIIINKPMIGRKAIRPYPENDCDWNDESCSGICFQEYTVKEQIIEKSKLASESTLKNLQALKDTMSFYPKTVFIDIKAEYPIVGYNKFNIGFVDIAIEIDNVLYPDAGFEESPDGCTFYFIPFRTRDPYQPTTGYSRRSKKIYVEIKPQVTSIGELIRQINLYRSHLDDGLWVVMTKTPNLKDVLASQDIHYYEFTE